MNSSTSIATLIYYYFIVVFHNSFSIISIEKIIIFGLKYLSVTDTQSFFFSVHLGFRGFFSVQFYDSEDEEVTIPYVSHPLFHDFPMTSFICAYSAYFF